MSNSPCQDALEPLQPSQGLLHHKIDSNVDEEVNNTNFSSRHFIIVIEVSFQVWWNESNLELFVASLADIICCPFQRSHFSHSHSRHTDFSVAGLVETLHNTVVLEFVCWTRKFHFFITSCARLPRVNSSFSSFLCKFAPTVSFHSFFSTNANYNFQALEWKFPRLLSFSFIPTFPSHFAQPLLQRFFL